MAKIHPETVYRRTPSGVLHEHTKQPKEPYLHADNMPHLQWDHLGTDYLDPKEPFTPKKYKQTYFDQSLCEKPVTCVIPDKGIKITGRCRKCWKCRRHQEMQYIQAMDYHHAHANRTWFITLTFNQPQLDAIHRKSLEKYPEDKVAQRSHVKKEMLRRCQDWMRKIQRQSNAKTHWLRVQEIGNGKRSPDGRPRRKGNPHFHYLIFEYEGQFKKEPMKQAWKKNGFLHHAVVKDIGKSETIKYIAKYIYKQKIATAEELYGYDLVRIQTSKHFRKAPEEEQRFDMKVRQLEHIYNTQLKPEWATDIKIGDQRHPEFIGPPLPIIYEETPF